MRRLGLLFLFLAVSPRLLAAGPDLGSIWIEMVMDGVVFGIQGARFVKSESRSGHWDLVFVRKGTYGGDGKTIRHPLPEPIEKTLSDLVKKPNGPWAFNSKESEEAGDVEAITLGKFTNRLEKLLIYSEGDWVFRSMDAQFEVTVNPDGSPAAPGKLVTAEIFRTAEGKPFRQVFPGMMSDGGSPGMRMTARVAAEIREFKARWKELCAWMLSQGMIEKDEEEE